MTLKKCAGCGEIKDIGMFHFNVEKNYHKKRCKPCNYLHQKAYQSRYRARKRAEQRAIHGRIVATLDYSEDNLEVAD